MKRLGSRRARGLAAVVALGLLTFPAAAAANTSEPIAQTGGMMTTLPLLGTTLTVDVTLDPVGNISGVTLTPVGDFASTTTEPGIVKFANTAGTTKVTVRAKGDRLSISAKSAALADFVGAGTWSADVFGTNADSTVPYTIGADGSGSPTLSIGTPTTPDPSITWELKPPSTDADDDGDASASGGVIFAHDGFTKRLKISIEVDQEDGTAHLKITLSGKDRQKLTAAPGVLAGARTWSAHLCDGTAVAVNYTVGADGTVTFDSATGGTVTVKTSDHGIHVRFDGTKVGVKIRVRTNEDGTSTLVVKGSSGKCGDAEDSDSHDGDAEDSDSHDGDAEKSDSHDD
ncbi:MAG: hypothetical protein AABZ33_13915 [Chloroflexota bacterium]